MVPALANSSRRFTVCSAMPVGSAVAGAPVAPAGPSNCSLQEPPVGRGTGQAAARGGRRGGWAGGGPGGGGGAVAGRSWGAGARGGGGGGRPAGAPALLHHLGLLQG